MRKLALLFPVLLGCSGTTDAPTAPRYSVEVPNAPMAIVVLAAFFDPETVAREYGVTPKYIYGKVLNGFAAPVNEIAKAGLMRDARVRRVSNDGVATLSATWGLDRINQRQLPLDNSYSVPNAGSGVKVYIIDSGIKYDHPEFQGRASNGADFSGDLTSPDCIGHGTHVAGTVGGNLYGVAKQVSLVSVRVFGCTGSTSYSVVLAAMDWVAANASGPSVVNMSLGGPATATVDEAVARLSSLGIAVVVAAGNEASSACAVSPAGAPSAITVGATSDNDARASFSNWGDCVDIFAPGVGIVSAWIDGSSRSLSGTSMASPHVAGVAALLLASGVTNVDSALKARATKGVVTNALSQVWHLLYSGTDDDLRDVGPGPMPDPMLAPANFRATLTMDSQRWPYAWLAWSHESFPGTIYEIWYRTDSTQWALMTNTDQQPDAVPITAGGIKYWFKVRATIEGQPPSPFSDSASVVSCQAQGKTGRCKR